MQQYDRKAVEKRRTLDRQQSRRLKRKLTGREINALHRQYPEGLSFYVRRAVTESEAR